MVTMQTTNQRNRILRLLQNGEKVKYIRSVEGVSNWKIYRIINETGVRDKRGYVKQDAKKSKKQGNVVVMEKETKPQAVCLGIGHCGTCKWMFQYPCKLGYDS
jgi:hypothetical protein